MSLKHGPKVKQLSPTETINSLEAWKFNILYCLRLNPPFRQYLVEGFVWGRKSRSRPYRSLEDEVVHHDESEDPVSKVKTPAYDEIIARREDRAADVDLLLAQIANFAECIPRKDITHDSESIDVVWQKIKLFYNLQASGSLLNECWNIKRLPEETPQALFARLKQAFDENLLVRDGLHHIEGPLDEDEEMTPTLFNTIILHWLELLHPKLRNLVTQRFATQLRVSTYGAIFPEISRSVESMLQELEDENYEADCRYVSSRRGGASNYTARSYSDRRSGYNQSKPFHPSNDKPNYKQSSYEKRCCQYCKLMNRKAYLSHNIEDCLFVKRESRMNLNRARLVEGDGPTDEESEDDEALKNQYAEFYQELESHPTKRITTTHVISKISSQGSPFIILYDEDGVMVEITLDTGATCNVIGDKKAKKHKCKIRPTRQTARMADGDTLLDVIGITDIVFYRNKRSFQMTTLVAANTDIEFLGGIPFMCVNDVGVRPATSEVILHQKNGGAERVKYDPARKTNTPAVKKLSQLTIQSVKKEVILPGESLKLQLPLSLQDDETIAVEPRLDNSHNRNLLSESTVWPPAQIVPVKSDTISLLNSTKEPVIIKKHEQICLLHDSTTPDPDNITHQQCTNPKTSQSKTTSKVEAYSNPVQLNPNNVLSPAETAEFQNLLKEYDEEFNPTVSQYNGARGNCQVEVNMGNTLPPQRKGRVPFYGRSNMQELQDKMDELVDKGVLAYPQDIGITVENVSPSFLVRKPSNPQKKRLVTDFGSIAPYCRPSPSLMPKINSVIQTVGGWNYCIITDCTESYYQLKMKRSSMRYCGTVSPFKGVLVYQVGVMGLPGVECALEELTCKVLGDLVQLGSVAKVADDIYIGGSTVRELFNNFKLVLHRFRECNLKLSARKTVIAPSEVTILGWVWSSGKIKASPHRLAALAEVKPPTTVSAMRSFIGAYRFLSRVLQGYATLLAPLEKSVCGNKPGNEEVKWSDELLQAFRASQEALKTSKTLTVPTPDDTLWIVTDASVKPGAVGATLYAVRNGEPRLAEFFNAKLPEFQSRWLPCEVEGIAIGSALHHFAPYIRQSTSRPQILTDSKPCTQAVQKMSKGQFPTSARLSTFLSAVHQYGANVRHLSGDVNLPSDFASRNPVSCESESCQICTYIKEYSESVVMSLVTVSDVLQGKVQVPYKNRKAWIEVQSECPDIRKVLSFMKAGTEPSKKSKHMKIIRRYLSASLVIASDGLLVQRKADPLSPMKDHIVVPQQVLHGILTSLHLKLGHPTAHQLTKVFNREFYALNVNNAILTVSKHCHLCESIKDVPHALVEQSTSEPPDRVGINLAADVVIRSKQKVLVLRETTTSYTLSELIPNETAAVVSETLVKMCSILRPSSIQRMSIRVDPAPANRSLFLNLRSNSVLEQHNIKLVVGRELSQNKNPVAEKSIRELSRELLLLMPESHLITPTSLALATANLNSRIRAPGLSAHELWTQRDQYTGEQLPLDDSEFIEAQHKRRLLNHSTSEKSKSHGRPPHAIPDVSTGSLVYLFADRDKEAPRPRYLVISINGSWCKLRRFTNKYFGTRTYDAKLTECFAVPEENFRDDPVTEDTDTESEYDSEDDSVDAHPITHPPVVSTPDATIIQRPHVDPPIPEELIEPVLPATQPEEAPLALPEDAVVPVPKIAVKRKKKVIIPATVETQSSRPRRVVKTPARYTDFVMGDETL